MERVSLNALHRTTQNLWKLTQQGKKSNHLKALQDVHVCEAIACIASAATQGCEDQGKKVNCNDIPGVVYVLKKWLRG